MSPINAYLTFDGNAAEALRFYERTLPRTQIETLMTFAQMPAGGDGTGCGGGALPEGCADRLMHGCLTFGGGLLMASDAMPGQPYEGIKGCAIALSCADNDEAQRVFTALAEGGRITMPLQPTFWAERFGMLTDRFGTPWLVNGTPVPL